MPGLRVPRGILTDVDGLFEIPGAGQPAPGAVPSAGSLGANTHASAPLAVRMRPRTIDELVGQQQLRAAGSPLRRLIEGDQSMSLLLWGPPGTGKTTIAAIVSQQTRRRFVEVSAVAAGVKEVRAAIDGARAELARGGQETVLFVDEVHRFTKAQQDALLPGVENRWVTLIAATTENPFFSVIGPLLSRSLLLRLQSLTDDDVAEVIDQALADERGLAGGTGLEEEARAHLVRLAGGDARRALTYLEAAAGAAASNGLDAIDLATAETAVDQAAVRYDRQGDQHYDVISAFIKSIRGSDPDAALHYLARMIEAGEDPRFIARRLVVHASEDIGLADPTALQAAVAAAQAVQLIGMPEAQDQPGAGHDPPRHRPEVQRRDHGDRRGHRRRQGGQDRPGAVAPARRPLRRREGPRSRQGLRVPARRALRRRRAAVPPRRPRRRRLLPADRLGAEAAVKERWERVRRIVRGDG